MDIEYIYRRYLKHLLRAEPVVPCIGRELNYTNRFPVDIVNLSPYPLLKSGVRRDIFLLKHDVVDEYIINKHALRSHHVK